MRGAVRSSNTVRSVEHTCNENKSIARVSRPVLPLAPNKVIARIRLAIHMRHDRTHDNGDEDTSKDEKHTQVTNIREDPVQEENDTAAEPGADDEADEDMPRFWFEAGMHKSIHGDGLLAQDRRHRGGPQNPGKTVPKTGEEPTQTTVFSSGDRSPMVNTTGRRHTGCQLCNRRCD